MSIRCAIATSILNQEAIIQAGVLGVAQIGKPQRRCLKPTSGQIETLQKLQ